MISEGAKEDTEDNTIYQMAFERVLSLFNDDPEEDIVANVSCCLHKKTLTSRCGRSPLGLAAEFGCNAVH